MLLAGYFAARRSIISRQFLDDLARLIMRILLPVMILANAMNGTDRAQLLECWPIMALSLGMYAGLILLTAPLPILLGLRGQRGRVYRAALIFGNSGFLGIPLILSICPQHGAVYIVLMSIVDQLLLWTCGVYLTTPKGTGQSFRFRNFLNPALCAVLLSVALLARGVHLPTLAEDTLLTLGKSVTPLCLIYLGGLLHFCDWKPVAMQKELYVGIVVKMIAFPLLYYFIVSHLSVTTEMTGAMTIVAALPTMTTIAMLTQSSAKEGDYALGLVLLTTLACLPTLAVVSAIIF